MVKTIVLYSSRTGNTKKVAEAICSVLPKGTNCIDIKNSPEDLESYDCIFMGFWIDKGTADSLAAEQIKKLHNPYIALFATLGADPESEHARKCLINAANLLPEGITSMNNFICQGAIDPKIIEMMYNMFPVGHPHGKTPGNDALHKRASTHPDDIDLKNAKIFAKNVWNKICIERK